MVSFQGSFEVSNLIDECSIALQVRDNLVPEPNATIKTLIEKILCAINVIGPLHGTDLVLQHTWTRTVALIL